MRQYRKKSMSHKPERDDRIKLRLLSFNEFYQKKKNSSLTVIFKKRDYHFVKKMTTFSTSNDTISMLAAP